MLDFIVLGIVPGTSFTVTFRWALVFALAFTTGILLYIEITKPRQTTDATTNRRTKSLSPRRQLA